MSIVVQQQLTMSSREIAELTGKAHRNVRRDIEAMLEELKEDVLSFEHIYLDSMNREQKEFLLDRDHVECLLAGYSAPLRMKVIRRLHELEQKAIESPAASPKASVVDFARLALDHLPNLGETAKQALLSEASEVAFGQRLIPLPRVVERLFLAGEVGALFGVTPNKIGRLANQNDMKTPEYGEYRLSKSKHSDRQVETFYYNQAAVDRFEQLLTPH